MSAKEAQALFDELLVLYPRYSIKTTRDSLARWSMDQHSPSVWLRSSSSPAYVLAWPGI